MSRYSRVVSGLVIASIIGPIATSALTADEIKAQIQVLLGQIAQLQAQIKAAGGAVNATEQSGSNVICSISRYPLKRGDRGGDVEALQLFLKSQGLFSVDITGYFGPITEGALIQFQFKAGLITKESEGGVFGPRTFQYVIATYCAKPPPPPPDTSNQCPNPPVQPTLTCTGQWEKSNDARGCHVGWTCVAAVPVTNTNKPPIISSIVGPTTVDINKSNKWRVNASDPEGNVLQFSVVWGDEGSSLSQLLNIAREGTQFSTTVEYSHEYKATGKYTIVVFAKDADGADTTATLAVQVNDPDIGALIGSGTSSCKLNGVTYENNRIIPTPACSTSATSGVCVSYPYLQCMSGQWVAISSSSGGWLVGDKNSCVINGKLYGNGDTYTLPENPLIGHGGAFDSAIANICSRPEIKATFLCDPQARTLTCKNGLWEGTYASYGYGALCVSSNGIVIYPGHQAYLQSSTGREDRYLCREGRWFVVDTYGTPTVQLASPPEITGEYFPPQDINVTP